LGCRDYLLAACFYGFKSSRRDFCYYTIFYSEYRQKVLDYIEAALRDKPVDFQVCVTPKTEKQGGAGIVEATNYLAEKCVSEGYDFFGL